VTHKGTIHELIRLPPGLIGIHWLPMHSSGTFTQSSFSLRRVGFLERSYRMLRRIVPVLWRYPHIRLKALGLDLPRMIVDLAGAYSLAGKLRAYTPAPSYLQWEQRTDVISIRDRTAITRDIELLMMSPRFVLLVAAPAGDAPGLERTLDSFRDQLYRNFDIRVLMPGQDNSSALEQAKGTYVAMLHAGDVLCEHALYWVARVIAASPGAGLVYSDEDRIDGDGVRSDPMFKPDWSPELLRSTNYIGQLAICRADVLMQAGDIREEDVFGSNHDLLLRITETLPAERIVHVPAVLIHRPSGVETGASMQAVQAHLARCGVSGVVEESFLGGYRIRYALQKDQPLVSIMVPTRDGLNLLERCLNSILRKSSYQNFEIVIIDNQSAEPDTLNYLARIDDGRKTRVLRYDAAFNYSAINNFAARAARGEVLCLLNNDTEVISPDWLEEMLGHLHQDQVGVVGAKLYYPDGRVQHAGDLIGVGGVANHAHAFLQRDDPGYCNRAAVAQDLSAVTAACMLTWRKLYLDLGGLDEQHLPVAFNDVDYCLRVHEAGFRVVWTPHAELYHHESVSRGKDLTPEKKKRAKREVAYMRKRWKHVLANDPYYNPNLSYERADFSLSHAPMVERPWQR